MAALESPAKINRLWKKINDRLGWEDVDDKNHTGKAKDRAMQHKKISRGLTVLKAVAKGGVKTPAKVKTFETNRTVLLRAMKRYCKSLRTKLEGIKEQTKFRKAVLALTWVVEDLAPMQVTEEDGDVELTALSGINTDKLEKSLDDPTLDKDDDTDFTATAEEPTATEQPTARETPNEAPKKTGSFVAMQQARLNWEQTRKTIQSELQKLEQSIVAAAREDDEVDAAFVEQTVPQIYSILDGLDTRLITKLDQALSAPDEATRGQFHGEAHSIIKEYMEFVKSNPLMGDVDDNGFVPVAVRSTAVAALKDLAVKLT